MSIDDQGLLLTQLGFESAAEFHRMVADVDLSSTERIAAFKHWQEHDGTKQGLMCLGESP